jgi:hypothetical protein
MVDFVKLVLELGTSELEQGEAKLKSLTVAGDKAEKSAKKLGSSAKASAAQLKQATKQVEKFGNGLKIRGGHIANLTALLIAGGK